MKRRFTRGLSTLLLLCAVVCAFYLREGAQAPASDIPVTRVFALRPTASATPCEVYRARRQEQRQEEYAALAALSSSGDERARARLDELLTQSQAEMALEGALAAMGHIDAICAVRQGSVTVCLQERLQAAQAAQIIALAEKITGVDAQNVFILD